MSRDDHVFTFTGVAIASAANGRASELLDELDEGAVAQARASLDAEISERLEQMLIQGWQYPRLNNTFANVASGPPSEQPVAIYVESGPFDNWVAARKALGRSRGLIREYLAAAARYRSQGDKTFELNSDDVAYFGLDKE